eukprot:TRINITY_DN26691_c0_g1_i2.p1 TRINITY_DN26691_c0_g1~~TRINITY_DN26691_c0_g1_i2.p1  ORF type:complete len:1069 (+),score=239.23 TRINITY_DN26691_c0_g1_i2:60-3266(+)
MATFEDVRIVKDSLRKHRMFEGCDDDFLETLARKMSFQLVKRDKVVVEKGAYFSSMVVVLHGVVDVVVDGVTIFPVERYGVFNEAALMGFGDTCPATVQVGAEVLPFGSAEVALLAREDFAKVAQTFPQYSERYAAALSTSSFSCLRPVCPKLDLLPGISTAAAPPSAVLELGQTALLARFAFPREVVLEAGADSDALYILLRGAVEIIDPPVAASPSPEMTWQMLSPKGRRMAEAEPPRRVVEVLPNAEPVVFGTSVLFGVRDAHEVTVVAKSPCYFAFIPRRHFAQIMQERKVEMQVDDLDDFLRDHCDGATLPPLMERTSQVEIFRHFSRNEKLMGIWCSLLQTRVYPPCAIIIKEGSRSCDLAMHILLRGRAQALRGGMQIGTLEEEGGVFGELRLFGIVETSSATIRAECLVITQILRESALIQGLRRCPGEIQKIMHMATRHLSDAGSSTSPSYAKRLAVQSVTESIRKSPNLAGLDDEFIMAIGEQAVDRVFLPGDLVMVQGAMEDTMFIMVSGTASVLLSSDEFTNDADEELAEDLRNRSHVTTIWRAAGTVKKKLRHVRLLRRPSVAPAPARSADASPLPSETPQEEKAPLPPRQVGILRAGSICGELAMLGIHPKRAATVRADTICCMWEISSSTALTRLEEFPNSLRHFRDLVTTNLESSVKVCMDLMLLLRNFDHHFRMKLGLFCERRAYFPGEHICVEGKDADGMYILCTGQVIMKKKNQKIMELQHGDHVNSLVMLGVQKKSYFTLTAVHTCHILVVNRHSYLQVLESCPSAREAAAEMEASEKAAFAEFQKCYASFARCVRGAERKEDPETTIRRLVEAGTSEVLTCVRRCIDPAIAGEDSVSRDPICKAVWRAWCRFLRFVRYQKAKASENDRRMRSVDQWIEERRTVIQALEQARGQTTPSLTDTRSKFSLSPLASSTMISANISVSDLSDSTGSPKLGGAMTLPRFDHLRLQCSSAGTSAGSLASPRSSRSARAGGSSAVGGAGSGWLPPGSPALSARGLAGRAAACEYRPVTSGPVEAVAVSSPPAVAAEPARQGRRVFWTSMYAAVEG